jgi:hypothetical protein
LRAGSGSHPWPEPPLTACAALLELLDVTDCEVLSEVHELDELEALDDEEALAVEELLVDPVAGDGVVTMPIAAWLPAARPEPTRPTAPAPPTAAATARRRRRRRARSRSPAVLGGRGPGIACEPRCRAGGYDPLWVPPLRPPCDAAVRLL